MKKLKKLVLGVFAVSILTGNVLAVNASCGGWSVVGVVDQYCATPGCNSDRDLWMYVTYKHQRECRSEYGTNYVEYKTETLNPGCC